MPPPVHDNNKTSYKRLENVCGDEDELQNVLVDNMELPEAATFDFRDDNEAAGGPIIPAPSAANHDLEDDDNDLMLDDAHALLPEAMTSRNIHRAYHVPEYISQTSINPAYTSATEENMKCVVSTVLFIAIVAAILVVALTLNPAI